MIAAAVTGTLTNSLADTAIARSDYVATVRPTLADLTDPI
eukprot:SAG22_NODE_13647_length_399_cov_1.026667_1_plen_39_part_10